MSDQSGPGQGAGQGGQQPPTPGYLIPSDSERGVDSSTPPPLPPTPAPSPEPPAPASGPAFTLPSAEPDSPVSGPSGPPPSTQYGSTPDNTQATGGYGPGAASTPGASYGPPAPGPNDAGSYGAPQYGQPSAPPYGQPSAPSYGAQSAPPAYNQPPPQQQYGQPGYGPTPGYGQPAAPAYPQGGYGTPPAQPQYGVILPPSKPPNSGLAIGAMVAGIGGAALGLFGWCSFLIGVPAFLAGGAGVIMGVIARRQIAASNGQAGGAGMALAGLICGAIGAAISLIGVIINLVLLGAAMSTSSY